jgi:hypothetical protein
MPVTAISGIYFPHISRTDGVNDDDHIMFVVRDDASHSDALGMRVLWQTMSAVIRGWGAY